MARTVMIISYAVSAIGIFLGFYWLGDDPQRSIEALTICFVIGLGALSWLRHFVLWRDDARMIGVEEASPIFHWEVGFANGAFAVAGILAIVLDLGTAAMAVVCMGYGAYIVQAAILHTWRYVRENVRSPQKLWGSILGSWAVALTAIVISLTGLSNLHLLGF